MSQFERDVIELGLRSALYLWIEDPDRVSADDIADAVIKFVNEGYLP